MEYIVSCQWVSAGKPEYEAGELEEQAGATSEGFEEAPNTGVLPNDIFQLSWTGTRGKMIEVFQNLSSHKKIHNLRLVRRADHDGNTNVILVVAA